MKRNQVRYYQNLTDDFFPDGGSALPEDYQWIRKDLLSRILSGFTYGLALFLSFFYCRLFLHVRYVGAGKLRKQKGGFLLYGNHTQPVGDVFIPAHACFPKRIYTVVSTANYGLPVIGRILPYLGALPVTEDLSGVRKLNEAVAARLGQGHPVVIYPEAHVWEYYTGIRPFSPASFGFPVRNHVPSYTMTVTYQKSRFFRRPKSVVYIDGPFYGTGESRKEMTRTLHDQVYEAMVRRSQQSNAQYIRYEKK